MKRYIAILAMACLVGLGPNAYAAPSLTTGGWYIVGNGFEFMLHIQAIDPQGNLSGTWQENARAGLVVGFWNEATWEIVFQRQGLTSSPLSIQTYRGYLFHGAVTVPPADCNGNIRQTMAGTFEAFQGSGATASAHEFGWVATICLIS